MNNIISITDKIVSSKYGTRIPAFVCATSIAVSSQLRNMEYQSTVQEIEKQLDSQLLDIIYPIQSRLNSYEQILYWVHGLFDASKTVTREEFKAYLNSLHLEQNFPEIPGVSVSFYIKWPDIKKHTNEIRKQWFPKYGNNFIADQTEYAPVTYIEPFYGQNLNVFGFDNFSDETRRQLLKDVQREYKPMLTPPIVLKQNNITNSKNFLMTYPVYWKLQPHTDQNGRMENIVWWWSLVFKMEEQVLKADCLKSKDIINWYGHNYSTKHNSCVAYAFGLHTSLSANQPARSVVLVTYTAANMALYRTFHHSPRLNARHCKQEQKTELRDWFRLHAAVCRHVLSQTQQ